MDIEDHERSLGELALAIPQRKRSVLMDTHGSAATMVRVRIQSVRRHLASGNWKQATASLVYTREDLHQSMDSWSTVPDVFPAMIGLINTSVLSCIEDDGQIEKLLKELDGLALRCL